MQAHYRESYRMRRHQKAVLVMSVFLIILFMLSSCAKRIYVPVDHTTTRTVTIRDTVVDVQLKVRHDTTTIALSTADTLSYLSNQYAYTYASTDSLGLHHSLGIHPQASAQGKVQTVTIHEVDSIPVPVEVVVEKKLSLWQRTKLDLGGYAILVLLVLLIAQLHKRKLL